MQGVVLSDLGSQVVVDVDGEELSCVIRKSLRRGRRRKAVVVGDRVTVEDGAVVAVEPRRNAISRRDPSHKRREQLLVANVDAVLIVASVREPDLTPAAVDRFLVAVGSRELEAAIAFNKIELDPDGDYRPFADVYRGLGYTVLETSAMTGEGVDEVRALLRDRTTTMLGHSGVGKSSLANALDPSLRLRTGEVRADTGKGMHTTSAVSLLRLPWGRGYLVDTPGIREFGLWGLEPRDVGFYLPEFAARLEGCRFGDCLHEQEPGCAVLAAVESGDIAGWRYDSYLRMLATLREAEEETGY